MLHKTVTCVTALIALANVSISMRQAAVHVRVAAGQRPIPCRITIVDSMGRLADFHVQVDPRLAIRKGVVYSSTGTADVSLSPGAYTVFATRGPLYSLAQRQITVGTSDQQVD